MIKLDMGIKFLFIKIIYLCLSVLLMGCNNKNSIKISELEPYDKEFLNELRKEYSVEDINEYNEAYRLYKLPALRRPEILTVFKVEDNWIFSHAKIDRIIGIVTLFENNDIEIIYDTSNYNLKNDMINNFLRGMNNLYKLNNYNDSDTFDLNMYYIEYIKNNESRIIIFVDDKSIKTIIYNKIINEFQKLVE